MAQRNKGEWIISAQDLIAHYECSHKLRLNLARSMGWINKPQADDPNLELLRQLGDEIEAKTLERLRGQTKVIELTRPAFGSKSILECLDKTKAATDAEIPVIYQATLFANNQLGIADFLILRKSPAGEVIRAADGRAIYEPVDSKSARSEKAAAALQVGFYAHLLDALGYPAPLEVHLWLAGENTWSGDAAKLTAVAREVLKEVAEVIQGEIQLPDPAWAPPKVACATCLWTEHCESGRKENRDLSLVQGIQASTRERLVQSGLTTIDLMASALDNQRPRRVGADTFSSLRSQAALQLRGESAGQVLAELREGSDLGHYPNSSPGDVWFDLEGDPYADTGKGHEYMFGVAYRVGPEVEFRTFDAPSLDEEESAFNQFMHFLWNRWQQFPDMHAFHYADYERRALTRLSQKYSIWVAELDLILRDGLLFDMYSFVRQGIRFSTPSLSIKHIEAIYGFKHEGVVETAAASVVAFHNFRALLELEKVAEAQNAYTQIRDYNEIDCRSTQALDDWIRNFAPENSASDNSEVSPPELRIAAPSEFQILANRLGELIAKSPSQLDEVERSAIAILRGALLFHEREDKVAWWHLFGTVDEDVENLNRKTGAMQIDQISATSWEKAPRAKNFKRLLSAGNAYMSAQEALEGENNVALIYAPAEEGMDQPSNSARGFNFATIQSFQDDLVKIEESARGGQTWDSLPIAITQFAQYNSTPLKKALGRLAHAVLASGTLPQTAWSRLLKVAPPELHRSGSDAIGNISATLKMESDCFVAVQGPPGTGKTYVGSRVIAELASAGWRIGVVAQSHTVVENLLEKVIEAAPELAVGKEPKSGQANSKPWHVSSLVDWIGGQRSGFVAGGTAWKFAKLGELRVPLDLLVVDEAGQFSIAMTLASAETANRILLLGDPQQLPQVSQAAHPEGAEVSALEHVAGQGHTLEDKLGYFLADSYRMHPEITRRVSALQYEGRLKSHPRTLDRSLEGVEPGVFAVPCSHRGNTTSSPEEAQETLGLVKKLLKSSWRGDQEVESGTSARALGQSDILVVAAFNDQVRAIRRVLQEQGLAGVRVGTVDKFQGQEAAVVIVSLAASSSEDLPRGVDFLLSPNRLNVAISRAMWASYIVHSPELRGISVTSVEGIVNLGGFLNLIES